MRWRSTRLCALLLVLMTGCPDGFGKGGRVDRGVHQDVMELRRKHCTKAELKRYCEGDKADSPLCRDRCG